jgi:hypothetical protein
LLVTVVFVNEMLLVTVIFINEMLLVTGFSQ